MEELTIKAIVSNISTVTDFVNEKLDTLNCPMSIRIQLNIAIDELFGNIARYAYESGEGPATVRVEVKEQPTCVIITFIDHGVPFDPLAMDAPDTTLSAKDRRIGGLGIFMVKKSMDNITYEYKDGMNILTIHKHLPSGK